MRDNLRTVYIMLVVVFVLIVINGGLLYYKNEIKNHNNTPITQDIKSPQPTSSVLSHEFTSSTSPSEWPTYTDKQNGYSIQYPPEFVLYKQPKTPKYMDAIMLMHKNGSMLNTIITIFVTEKKAGDSLVIQSGFDGNGNSIVVYPFLIKNSVVRIVGVIHTAKPEINKYELIIKQIVSSFKIL